jgi:hypothetical protein
MRRAGRERRVACMLLVCAVLGGLLPASLVAQEDGRLSVLITVLDRLGGTPISGAVVTLTPLGTDGNPLLPGTGGTVVGTDEDGRVRLSALAPGRYAVDVRAPSYRALEETLLLVGPPPVTVTIQLSPDVVALDGLVAIAERNPFLDSGGFYERQARGLGVTFTRRELEATGVFQATDVFRSLSGTTLDYAGSPTSPFVRFRGGCRPDIVVDGANLGGNVRLDDVVNPSTIEGLEVYRGTTVPGTLSDNPCGAVLIWTLRPVSAEDDPFSWRQLAFGVVTVVLFQLIRPRR